MRFFSILALVVLSACSWHNRVKYLSDDESSAYYALNPFMTEDMKKTYLFLKTEEERTAYLKSVSMERVPPITLYDMFYQYDEHIRQAIVDGAVQVGWRKDEVLMSWGAPYDKRHLAGRPAPRSEMLIYKFEKQADGTVYVYTPDSKTEYKAVERFRREVILDSDIVAEIIEKPGWGN